MAIDDAKLLAPLYGRRSIRADADTPVEDDTITALLKAAMAAPSAVAKDPWHFIVVKDRDRRRALTEKLPNGKMLQQAPLGIVVCGDMDRAHTGELSYCLQDCSAAIENLLVAAHLLGLGACWLGVHPREERVKDLSEKLSLPKHVFPVAVIAVGYPAETKEPRTRYREEAVHSETW